MAKRISMAPKPTTNNAEEWISGATNSGEQNAPTPKEIPVEPTPEPELKKRLTIDISDELHARIKSQCALKRTKMVDEIRQLLEKHFSANP